MKRKSYERKSRNLQKFVGYLSKFYDSNKIDDRDLTLHRNQL